MDSFDDEFLEKLILDGMVEFAGLDQKTGEMLYSFTDKAMRSNPDFFTTVMDSQVRDIYSLWERGFLDMNIAESNPLVRITKKALDRKEVDGLPIDLRLALEQIIEISRIDEE